MEFYINLCQYKTSLRFAVLSTHTVNSNMRKVIVPIIKGQPTVRHPFIIRVDRHK